MSSSTNGNLLVYTPDEVARQEASRDPYRKELEQVVGTVLPLLNITPDSMIVEVGSGYGALSKAFPEDARSRIVGTDKQFDIVDGARSVFDQGVVADMMHLPFAGGSVDLITGMDVLHWVPDMRVGLAEVARSLKLGGTACFFQGSRPGTIFLTADETVGVPVAVDGQLRVFEVDESLFFESWQRVKEMIDNTLPESLGFLASFLDHYPNIFYATSIENCNDQSSDIYDLYRFLFTTINTAILGSAFQISRDPTAVRELYQSMIWDRYRATVERVATEKGMSFRELQFGGQPDSKFNPTAWILRKYQ